MDRFHDIVARRVGTQKRSVALKVIIAALLFFGAVITAQLFADDAPEERKGAINGLGVALGVMAALAYGAKGHKHLHRALDDKRRRDEYAAHPPPTTTWTRERALDVIVDLTYCTLQGASVGDDVNAVSQFGPVTDLDEAQLDCFVWDDLGVTVHVDEGKIRAFEIEPSDHVVFRAENNRIDAPLERSVDEFEKTLGEKGRAGAGNTLQWIRQGNTIAALIDPDRRIKALMVGIPADD